MQVKAMARSPSPFVPFLAMCTLVLVWTFWFSRPLQLFRFDLMGEIEFSIPNDSAPVDPIPTIETQIEAHPVKENSKKPPAPIKDTSRALILYIYAESVNARQNLEFFIRKGLHGAADFVFIFNGETNATELLPREPNIKLVQRGNKCFDLGTIGEVLIKDGLWKKYKRFITLNASIRGPFLPMYSSNICWTDVFLDRVTDQVKLVGTTYSCQPRPHIQSMLFATDDIGMGILLDPKLATSAGNDDGWPWGTKDDPIGFTPCYETIQKAIHAEIWNTELIRMQGYEVDSLLTAFHAATPETYCDINGNPGDILYDKKYYGANIHPYETIFIKANRNIDPVLLEDMTRWHLSQNTTSWDACGSRT